MIFWRRRLENNPLFVWVLAGACLGFSMISPWASILLLPGLLCFIWGLTLTTGPLELFWYSWLAGTLKILGALAWLWQLDPVAWYSTSQTALNSLIIAFYWLTTCLVIGLSLSVVALLFWYLQQRTAFVWWILPIIWTAAEVIGSGFFTLFTWSPLTPVHLGMTLGYTGYSLIQIPAFTSIAAIAGVYGLSLFGCVLSILLFFCIHKRSSKHAVTLATIVFLATFGSWLLPEYQQQNLTVVVAETNYPMRMLNTTAGFEQRNLEGKEMVDTALLHSPDYIILQEHGNFTGNFTNPAAALVYLQTEVLSDVVLIDTYATTATLHRRAITGHVYDTKHNKIETTYKAFLTPLGEYLPVYQQILLELTTPRVVWERFVRNKNMITPKPEPRDFTLPGVLFCYESLVPWRSKKLSREETPFVAHTVSHGWFIEASILTHQQTLMLRSQAVFSRKPIIQATNLGSHAIYYPDNTISSGKLLDQAEFWKLFEVTI